MEELYRELPRRFSGDRKNKYLDQVYLTAVIWPLAISKTSFRVFLLVRIVCMIQVTETSGIFLRVDDSVQHDSYHCFKFPGSRPFPTKRESGYDNFVGSNRAFKSVSKECPMQCRPRQHLDWHMC